MAPKIIAVPITLKVRMTVAASAGESFESTTLGADLAGSFTAMCGFPHKEGKHLK